MIVKIDDRFVLRHEGETQNEIMIERIEDIESSSCLYIINAKGEQKSTKRAHCSFGNRLKNSSCSDERWGFWIKFVESCHTDGVDRAACVHQCCAFFIAGNRGDTYQVIIIYLS